MLKEMFLQSWFYHSQREEAYDACGIDNLEMDDDAGALLAEEAAEATPALIPADNVITEDALVKFLGGLDQETNNDDMKEEEEDIEDAPSKPLLHMADAANILHEIEEAFIAEGMFEEACITQVIVEKARMVANEKMRQTKITDYLVPLTLLLVAF